MSQTVKDCLERANKNGFSSVALPDLGSTIGYPAQILAKLMFTAVEDFAKQHPNPTLNQVVFCLSKKTISDVSVACELGLKKTKLNGIQKTYYCKQTYLYNSIFSMFVPYISDAFVCLC